MRAAAALVTVLLIAAVLPGLPPLVLASFALVALASLIKSSDRARDSPDWWERRSLAHQCTQEYLTQFELSPQAARSMVSTDKAGRQSLVKTFGFVHMDNRARPNASKKVFYHSRDRPQRGVTL